MSTFAGGRVAIAGLIGLALVAVLAGCATSTKPVTDYRGEPKGVQAPASSAGGAPFAVWLKGGDEFAVTLYGSVGCPPIASGYRLTGSNRMTIALAPAPKKHCTFGYTPHTTVFETPNTVDPHLAVRITAQDVIFTLEGLM